MERGGGGARLGCPRVFEPQMEQMDADCGVVGEGWLRWVGTVWGLTRRGEGLVGGRVRSLAIPGAGRRTPCAERAVISDSSPEPAAGWFGDMSAASAGSVSGCCVRPVADADGWNGCGLGRRADDWADDWTDVFDTGAFASSRVTSPHNCSRRTPLSCARRSCIFSLTSRRITVPSSRTRGRPARPSSCR